MGNFDFTFNLDSIIPKGLNDENLALSRTEAMQKAIQSGASKHKKTGNMASSVKCSKPTINRNRDAVGRVKFYGKDKNGMQNWYKAIWIEHGTRHQAAQPFVRPAIKGCESAIRATMERVFEQKMKG